MRRGVFLPKNLRAKDFGGKDSVKENRQGCLSRINQEVFRTFAKVRNTFETVDNFFRQSPAPRLFEAGRLFAYTELK